MLPPKNKPLKSGILREPKRSWPKHRNFVRKHMCCVPGCENRNIQFAHIRNAANSGTGLKPHDMFGISLCVEHHSEQHQKGALTFEKKHKIDLFKLAAEFVKHSTDIQMKEAMRGEVK